MPRVLLTFGLGLFFTLFAATSPAVADDSEHGEDQVTILVTIKQFDPCAVGAPGCPGGLPTTGGAIGIPIGAGVLLIAVGASAYALRSHRRSVGGA